MSRKKIWTPIWSRDANAWIVDFRVNGKRIRRRLPCHDPHLKSKAREMAYALYRQAWETAVASPEPSPAKSEPLSFAEAARLYIDQGGEERFLPRLVEYFGRDVAIADIDEVMMARAARALYPDVAPDTVRRQLRVPIRAVQNFAAGRRRQKHFDNRRVRWLTPEEAEKLLLAAGDPATIGLRDPNCQTLRKIAFMLGTGAGPGETMALTASGWNPATREWWLPGKKTVYRARFVRLPTRAVELIGKIPETGPAFPAPNGQPYKFSKNRGGQMAGAFNKVRNAAGLDDSVTCYTLRHSWATWLAAQTKDWGLLLDQGGWNRVDTANRYRKIAPDDLGARLLAYGWDFRPEEAGPVRFGELVELGR